MKNRCLQIPDEYVRTIVCGDIHGCFKELQRLLEIVGFCRSDVLVSTGDMVDRGPRSWDVCRFFRDTPNAYSVLGNHERRVAGTIRGTSKPAWSQRHSLAMLDQNEWTMWAAYFESLPAVIETQHAIITHARLDSEKSLQDQDPYFTCAVGGSRIQIPLDETGVPLWFVQTDYPKPICVGHIRYERVELVAARLFALDTRSVRGGELTCVVFPGCERFSVKADRDYYTESLKDWQTKEMLALDDPDEWPLQRVVMFQKENIHTYDPARATAALKFRSAIEALDISSWARGVREQLLKRFGRIPDPGPERGEYLVKVKSSFADKRLGSLAVKVLVGSIDRLEVFVPVVKKGTFANVKVLMHTIAKAIDDL